MDREVVTVSRAGSKRARCNSGFWRPIYCTAIYRAVARRRDGVETWRRIASVDDSTSGLVVTEPMLDRARQVATELGLPFCEGVRHGQLVTEEE